MATEGTTREAREAAPAMAMGTAPGMATGTEMATGMGMGTATAVTTRTGTVTAVATAMEVERTAETVTGTGGTTGAPASGRSSRLTPRSESPPAVAAGSRRRLGGKSLQAHGEDHREVR